MSATVLVVDDEEVNVDYLVTTLADDVDLAVAMDGATALDLVKRAPPDLVLLDVMMPGMDGFEVCRRLHEDEATRDIPVIFVTAVADTTDVVRGLELGAVDYILKPFEPMIVRARVRNHLTRKLALEQIREQNEALREAAAFREDVERITRHDLKGPLNSVLGYAEILLEDGGLTPEQEADLLAIKRAGHQMLGMINLSLDLFKMERGIYHVNAEPVDVLRVAHELARDYAAQHRVPGPTIEVTLDGRPPVPGDTFVLPGERLLFYSALGNLVKNAVEASPADGVVRIALTSRPQPTLEVWNRGAVPAAIRDRFFEKYVTFGKARGTGLGTYSARLFTEALGGRLELDASVEGETRVVARYPAAGGQVTP